LVEILSRQFGTEGTTAKRAKTKHKTHIFIVPTTQSPPLQASVGSPHPIDRFTPLAVISIVCHY